MPDDLVALCGDFAADDALEPAYRALALTLPSEADIAREMGSNIDPDAILTARTLLVRAIAKAHRASFEALHAAMSDTGPFNPDADSAGRRALKNVLLDYLAAGSHDATRAARHYAGATNMTDRAAALAVLVNRHAGAAETTAALAGFERRYRNDPLVLDKWFQIQAAAPGPETLEAVRALVDHPAFSIANPNRLRALVGTFSSANQTGFHRADGEGYRFFGDIVLAVDRKNPQVAARLATALRSWRSLEPDRKAVAREALLRMVSADGLSVDLRDIVERTLA
ncbi:MAG: aminopeptidase N C-terminal domain-containing protein, partial [Nitratireductor sp.]